MSSKPTVTPLEAGDIRDDAAQHLMLMDMQKVLVERRIAGAERLREAAATATAALTALAEHESRDVRVEARRHKDHTAAMFYDLDQSLERATSDPPAACDCELATNLNRVLSQADRMQAIAAL